MNRAMLAAAAVAVFVLASLAPDVLGQQETVELQLRLGRGEVHYLTDTGTLRVTIDAPEAETRVEGRYEARQVLRVLDVDAAGIMLVEFVLEDYRVTFGGDTEESIDEPLMVRVRPDGRVVERLTGGEGVEDFPFALPGRPVRVGETWTRRSRFGQSGFTAQGTTTFTLAAVDRRPEGRVARVRYSAQGTMGADDLPMEVGAEARVTGTMVMSGEFQWLIERGRLVGGASEMNVTVEAERTAQGQVTRVKLTARGESRQEPLAASSVRVPPVTPDVLIAPGRSLGAFSLAATVADLTGRLGQPEELPANLGFRAPGIAWRSGLVAWLDESDRNRVIGLDIADRRYRTERGIGFGSSEGAVLMAYGMSPVKVPMMLPNVGGVRVLIYNDQGIAFAITSDAEHARRGEAHAPVGAVDWITVFPPGGAGKIYPVP